MNFTYHTDQEFKNKDLTSLFENGEYDNCSFVNCNLEGADLSGCRFINTQFEACNLSNVKLDDTSFQQVQFESCKMIGFPMENCSEFGLLIQLNDCQLEHASFYKVKLNRSLITNSLLHFADFTEANLEKINLAHCDLKGATFYQTNLKEADFRGSTNYTIDPESNQIKGAKFSLPDVTGLLEKYQLKIE